MIIEQLLRSSGTKAQGREGTGGSLARLTPTHCKGHRFFFFFRAIIRTVPCLYHTSVVETRADCGAAIIRTVPCMYHTSVVETRAASEGTDIAIR